MDALLSMHVPDAFENIVDSFDGARTARPCAVITRLHMQCATMILRYGARASTHALVEHGKQARTTCAWSYRDVLAAAVLHQWQRQANKDYLGIVADLVSMRHWLISAALC